MIPPVKKEPQRTLLTPDYPLGFEVGGRRLVAECQEFKLWEMYRPCGETILETSARIESALYQAWFRISEAASATSKDERLAMALALDRLASFTASCSFEDPIYGEPENLPPEVKGRGGVAAATRLAHTVGRKLLEIEKAPPSQAKQLAEDLAATFKNSVMAYARAKGKLEDQRNLGMRSPSVIHLILFAKLQFRQSHRRPAKSELKEELERMGKRFSGKDAKGKWSDLFMKSGLGDLPDSPPL